MKVDVCIVGGGICGVLAAHGCIERGLSFVLLEKNSSLGGCWQTLANDHSTLQAFEPNYRWHEDYRLSKDPLTRNSAQTVRKTMKRFVDDFGINEHTHLMTRVDSVDRDREGFAVSATDLITGDNRHYSSDFLFVACGILSHEQWTLEERGIDVHKNFNKKVMYAARKDGKDCPIASMDLTGKRVLVVGSGSFAAEAMEAAERQGCEDITMIGRPRYRLILPFSRQYTVSAIANCPLVPWSLRMRIALSYIKRSYYNPCNLSHWAPKGKPDEMDFAGQCNDGIFRLSHTGKLKCVVGRLNSLSDGQAHLESGESIQCDLVIVASGLKYNLTPDFLHANLGLDFTKLHNFAFLGRNPRIGCAADFLFAYVPFGPMKQLQMFFHAVDCCKKGLEREITNALHPTPLPNHGDGFLSGGRMAGSYTFFEYSHWWSMQSKALEARINSMLRTLDVGRSLPQRIALRVGFLSENLVEWVRCIRRSYSEITRFKVFGHSKSENIGAKRSTIHVTC